MIENWKDISNYENIYKISNLGRLKNIVTNKILKPSINQDGYERYFLYDKNHKRKCYFAHRLVCQQFLTSFNINLQVNHKDGIKTNNNIFNLEMITCKENINHAFKVLKRKGSNLGMINKSVKSIKIDQFSLGGVFIKTWSCAREIERQLGIANTNISRTAKGITKTAGKFIWKYN